MTSRAGEQWSEEMLRAPQPGSTGADIGRMNFAQSTEDASGHPVIPLVSSGAPKNRKSPRVLESASITQPVRMMVAAVSHCPQSYTTAHIAGMAHGQQGTAAHRTHTAHPASYALCAVCCWQVPPALALTPTLTAGTVGPPTTTQPPPPPLQMPLPLPPPTTTDWSDINFTMPGNFWLTALEKRVAAHIRIPRSGTSPGKEGTARPSFKIPYSPPDAVRLKCQEAGIPCVGTTGELTKYEGKGPMMAYRFCNTHVHKKLGQGSGALMAPGKNRKDSDVLIFAIPPVSISHNSRTWEMKVEFYLGVFNGEGNNQEGRFTPPPWANQLYGTQNVETIFTNTALKILGDMHIRGLPISKNFRTILGPEYASDAGEASEEEEEKESESEEEEPQQQEEWQAVKLTGKRKWTPLLSGQPGWTYEVKWSGRWANTFEPAEFLSGWEEEMAKVDKEAEEA